MNREEMRDQISKESIPPELTLSHSLREHGAIFRLAWSPDGQMLASGCEDGTVHLWDATEGKLLGSLEGHFEHIKSIAWSPDGTIIAAGCNDRIIRLWDVSVRRVLRELRSHARSIISIAWSGNTIATVGDDKTIDLWHADGRWLRNFETNAEYVAALAWSPNGRMLAAGDWSGVVWIWSVQKDKWIGLQGQFGRIFGLAWSPNGQMLAVCGADKSITLWDSNSWKLLTTLHGHVGSIRSVAFSFDGRLIASKSADGTVRIWNATTGHTVAILNEPASQYWVSCLTFHPAAPVLATLGDKDTVIRIFDLDFDALIGVQSVARETSYANAKVVLVGDTGVGKTALGVRLAEGVWRPTPGSTHGMKVWLLDSEPQREVMLWDFAGQDEYRLVHQLFLNETTVALLLYDPTKSNDVLFGIDYWEKTLQNVVLGNPCKILVAARVDVGGVRMTAEEIANYCQANDYLGHYATSAETGEGCPELRTKILDSIPWKDLPRTSSPEVFKRIKNFLAAARRGHRTLVRESDLREDFRAQTPDDIKHTQDEFSTVIGHVETTGLIKRLSFGDFVLLKPEFLNCYASDIVDAARRHAEGLGAVRKNDVLNGRITHKDDCGLEPSDRIFLLHATVELFLRLGLALEQDGNLVFPSKFNRRMPPLTEDPVVQVEFSFAGPVESLYTTLVVKLYYGGIYRLKKLWQNAAEFINAHSQVCGFQLHDSGGGFGMLKVFYAEGVSDDDKALFLKIIADHFREKRVAVERRRIYRCPSCRELVRDPDAANRAMGRKKNTIFCQDCGLQIPLVDALELLYRDDRKFLVQIAQMENRAESRMEHGGEMVSAAAESRTENFKAWAGGADVANLAIVFTDMVGGTESLVDRGDEYWEKVWEDHLTQTQELVRREHGYLLKTKGDGVIAAFHDAGSALDFALALVDDPGTAEIRIRAGIHIGPVGVSADDVFGQQVNLVARIEAKAEQGGIWVSAKVKDDIGIRKSAKHRNLVWTPHPDEELKGFPGLFMLWSVAKIDPLITVVS